MQKLQAKAQGRPIMVRMLIPMFTVVLIQSVIFAGNILWGGTIKQLNQNSIDIFSQRVISRKNYIENEMIQRWSNLDECYAKVNSIISAATAGQGISAGLLGDDLNLSNQVLSDITPELIYLLRKNSVTGAFVVLNGEDSHAPSKGEEIHKSGIYLRDLDPLSTPRDNSDLLAERTPSALAKQHNITLDSGWQSQFEFTDEGYTDYYYKPYLAALLSPDIAYSDLGYWSHAFYLSGNDTQIITYSVPLIDENGLPYGVMGIELTVDYMRSLLPYDELNNQKQGAYVMAVMEGEKGYLPTVKSGPIAQQVLGSEKNMQFTAETAYDNSYIMVNSSKGENNTYCNVQTLQLYNTNTPFEQENWALIGIIEKPTLLEFAHTVEKSVLYVSLLGLLISVLYAVFMGTRLTSPIVMLVKKLRETRPDQVVSLPKINIREIDKLSTEIEQLNSRVMDSASKLTQIIEMAGIPIGAFEWVKTSDIVFCTQNLFKILSLPVEDVEASFYLSASEFRNTMEKLVPYCEPEGDKTLISLQEEDGTLRWVRIQIIEDDTRLLGVAVDITLEMLEKRKLEYERDYDLLTNLYNRRAFHSTLQKLFSSSENLNIAACVMLDLDNLKYINDTYGHDYGDQYIRLTGEVLKKYLPYSAVLGHISGDEFCFFLFGYRSKEALWEIIREVPYQLAAASIFVPGNQKIKIRASTGVSWYPENSTSYEALIRYADFAMYQVKHNQKGGVLQFRMEDYDRDAYLLQSKEELNLLIENELVQYIFQPIFDAHTGEVFAYEALMRSRMDTLSSPLEILALARSQSKLYQIERLTLFKAMETFVEKREEFDDTCRIFVNSIPNQCLSEEDITRFVELYHEYFPRLVIEITEEDKFNDECVKIKQELAKKWNMGIALDDYGSGYNGDGALLELNPNYVKIDMSIVRNVHIDANRRSLLKNLVQYIHGLHLLVIAEGVENRDEMAVLIAERVDFLQGYYLAKPNPNPKVLSEVAKAEIRELNQENPYQEG